MKRRALLGGLGATLLFLHAPPLLSQGALRRVAWVHPGSRAGFQHLFNAFKERLRELGHVEDRNLSIDVRWAEGRTNLLPALAAEAIAQKPAVIVTASSAGVAACRKATSSIPIVFATAGNPVEQGFVSSFQRPGGNVTGVVVYTGILAKLVELAREALPAVQRIALLVNPDDPAHRFGLTEFTEGARRFKFEPIVVHVTHAEGFEKAFDEMRERKVEAVMVSQLEIFQSNRKQIIALALKARLPLLSGHDSFAPDGAILSYGTSRAENYRRAAALVDRILKGAKPADLPVEQPERFQLVINRRTAKQIGVELSPVTMLRADRVID